LRDSRLHQTCEALSGSTPRQFLKFAARLGFFAFAETPARTATLFFFAFCVFLDVIHSVFHGGDLFRVFVGNLDPKIFLESHYEFDGVQRVGAQVVHKRRGRRHFAFIHTKLLYDNLLHAFFDAGHSGSSSGICDLNIPGRTAGK
jgi:hypothetical protein